MEINIGLLGAVAIVASLLSAVFETKFYNRWASYAVACFGLVTQFPSENLTD